MNKKKHNCVAGSLVITVRRKKSKFEIRISFVYPMNEINHCFVTNVYLGLEYVSRLKTKN